MPNHHANHELPPTNASSRLQGPRPSALTVGRWAPSPTGDLHLGNLRTALLAWLFARSAGGRFFWRFEDLDGAVRDHYYDHQLRDLGTIGLDWDGVPMRQSERLDTYRETIDALDRRGLTYRCWCTRREIQEAASAPHHHLPDGAYPGTCRELSEREIRERERSGRPPALRLRAHGESVTVTDRQLGAHTGVVDDLVLRRGDGTPAYNLVVVVDDAALGVTEVVRGDDLLPSTPRQVRLAGLLGVEAPGYAHVPLVLNADGRRLAKRDGAVTLEDRQALGESPTQVLNALLGSLGLPVVSTVEELSAVLPHFDPAALPRRPWVFTAD
jgi:glutamyl-tRNA synthetase